MMLAKLFNKKPSNSQKHEGLIDVNPRAIVHYGIPATASRLAYDPIQQLLAIGTLDGRIKVIGSDKIEGLLTSPKGIPFKNLEFLQNQGFLVSISNENDVQAWDLEHRCIASSLQWKSNITAFSVIQETDFMYLGDECGLVSVVKFDVEERKLLTQKFSIPAHSVSEAAAASLPENLSVVGVLPQPCSFGKRVLFAYDIGVIVLWDISKDQLVLIKGLNDKKQPADDSTNVSASEQMDKTKGDEQEDKEIISLCWASLDGSILAVGYVDGNIVLWKLSGGASTRDFKAGQSTNDAIKLQLSAADRRFPVITLQWSASGPRNDNGGQLFVYGGDEIGSSEVLTMLSLEWSPGRDALKNVFRTNIALEGSFADMILLPSFNVVENTGSTSLFLLSSPGQLLFYDGPLLSRLVSPQPDSSTTPVHYRSAIPTTEPYLTVGKLILIHGNSRCSMAWSEMAAELEKTYQTSTNTSMWPLNGGIPCQLPPPQERVIERLYISGYQDGSVRIWDATYPMLSPLCVLYSEVGDINIPGAAGSISALDFSLETSNIAVGNSHGLVCLYSLAKSSRKAKVHVVTGSEREVYDLDQGNGSGITAVFSLGTSPVCTLRYTELGARLAVGYESGQVAVLSIDSYSLLFLTDALPNSSSPVVSLCSPVFEDSYDFMNTLDESGNHGKSESGNGFLFALRRDMLAVVLDSSNGNVISSLPVQHKESFAVSMYILEDTKCVSEAFGRPYLHTTSQQEKTNAEPEGTSDHSFEIIDGSKNVVHCSEDMQILICCTDVLLLYSLKSLLQGHADSVHEVSLKKPNCWTTILKVDEEKHGLLLLYQNGSVEFRSLPKLEVLGELSLMSTLRWNFKTNMEKSITCTENGLLALVNGCEFAIMPLLARENDFRYQQSLPCLHDKALAAALNMNFSPKQQKDKGNPSGILGGIVKGLRASKDAQCKDYGEDQQSIRSSLDRIFSRSQQVSTTAAKDAGEILELNIDDIQIDEPLHISPIAQKKENEKKDTSAERKKLFEGATSETKPKQRTVEEIKAKYRKTGDASSAVSSAASAASEAKNKLLERGEKLDRLSKNSEELRDGAENFASMAKELAKRMENRKWWQI